MFSIYINFLVYCLNPIRPSTTPATASQPPTNEKYVRLLCRRQPSKRRLHLIPRFIGGVFPSPASVQQH
ncbi:hypothetical protein V9T40_014676 [Parthenolecanium corni]|uniref:Uncharacterized protein n=1 Tax=Parthenolecanium corni TaxID=536013 RepID=A0AAN9XX44_9HEMI